MLSVINESCLKQVTGTPCKRQDSYHNINDKNNGYINFFYLVWQWKCHVISTTPFSVWFSLSQIYRRWLLLHMIRAVRAYLWWQLRTKTPVLIFNHCLKKWATTGSQLQTEIGHHLVVKMEATITVAMLCRKHIHNMNTNDLE